MLEPHPSIEEVYQTYKGIHTPLEFEKEKKLDTAELIAKLAQFNTSEELEVKQVQEEVKASVASQEGTLEAIASNDPFKRKVHYDKAKYFRSGSPDQFK